jgi:hypothetical protein
MAGYQTVGCPTEAGAISENLIPKVFKANTKWDPLIYDLEHRGLYTWRRLRINNYKSCDNLPIKTKLGE